VSAPLSGPEFVEWVRDMARLAGMHHGDQFFGALDMTDEQLDAVERAFGVKREQITRTLLGETRVYDEIIVRFDHCTFNGKGYGRLVDAGGGL
jgi:hypothetical protein